MYCFSFIHPPADDSLLFLRVIPEQEIIFRKSGCSESDKKIRDLSGILLISVRYPEISSGFRLDFSFSALIFSESLIYCNALVDDSSYELHEENLSSEVIR